MFFPGLHWLPHDSLLFRLLFDSSRANCCQSWPTAGARAGYSVQWIYVIGLLTQDSLQKTANCTCLLWLHEKLFFQLLVRILNLMLFFIGIEDTVVAAKDSSWLDVEIRHKHNLPNCLWAEAEKDKVCSGNKIGLHKGCTPQLHVGSPRTCANAPRISNAKSLIRKSRYLPAQHKSVTVF